MVWPRFRFMRIAEQAGTSIGNLYKYFANKEALFQAAVPAAVAPQLARLLRQQIEALHGVKEVRTLPAGHPITVRARRSCCSRCSIAMRCASGSITARARRLPASPSAWSLA